MTSRLLCFVHCLNFQLLKRSLSECANLNSVRIAYAAIVQKKCISCKLLENFEISSFYNVKIAASTVIRPSVTFLIPFSCPLSNLEQSYQYFMFK